MVNYKDHLDLGSPFDTVYVYCTREMRIIASIIPGTLILSQMDFLKQITRPDRKKKYLTSGIKWDTYRNTKNLVKFLTLAN